MSRLGAAEEKQLPAGDVLVAVEWAGLNYKDALCLTGKGNLVKAYPHVGGIDFAGRVLESRDSRYAAGQAVVLTGWHVGERRWGGYAERARVEAGWLVPCPAKMSTRTAMVLGTAGLTAMLAINRLRSDGLSPDKGEVVVTGASGGVGSIAVMLLSRLGHRVVAVTGSMEAAQTLRRLGADSVIDRREVLEPSGKGLDAERWAAAIDPVGGPLLGEVLKKIRHGGAVAVLGNAGGMTWEASVAPFILRNISLFGISSVTQSYEARVAAWERLASLFVPNAYETMVRETALEELPGEAERILAGGIDGRVIVEPRRVEESR